MFYLIIFDFIWSALAFIVDYPKFFEIPTWAVAFAIICPIYPLLLSIVWINKYRGKRVNPYLMAFAVLPSAVFGILALIFYPALTITRGFQWNDFGEIFWVLFYSAQGWYLLKKEKFYFWPVVTVLMYLLVKFTLDYKFSTFGYLETNSLTKPVLEGIFGVAIIASFALGWFSVSKKTS